MNGLRSDTELLHALVRYAGVTATEVAKRAKLAPSTINRPYNGTATTRLSLNTIEKLRGAYPDFPGWGGDVTEVRSTFNHQLDDRDINQSPDTIELEQIDLRFGMGGTYADGPVTVERRSFSREWLRSITSISPQNLFWAVGDGDSMEPTIRSGEILLIDRSQDNPRSDGLIWAVAHGEVGMIRRLRFIPQGPIELHSDNPNIPPQTAVDGSLHVIGRVIAVVRKL